MLRFIASFARGGAQRIQRGFSALELLIFVVVAAAVLPTAIDAIVDVDTTGWPAAATTLWDLSPVFIAIGVLYALYRMATRGGKSGI